MLPLIVWDIIELSYPEGRQQCSGPMIIAMVNWILFWNCVQSSIYDCFLNISYLTRLKQFSIKNKTFPQLQKKSRNNWLTFFSNWKLYPIFKIPINSIIKTLRW